MSEDRHLNGKVSDAKMAGGIELAALFHLRRTSDRVRRFGLLFDWGAWLMRISHAVLGSMLSFHAVEARAQVIQEPNVSFDMAYKAARAALQKCTTDGFKVVVVVVDRSGATAVLLRGDGVNPHNTELARRKAYTSRTFRQTTIEFLQRSENPVSTGLRSLPDVTWSSGGGAPIMLGSQAIGGIGVSGAPGGAGDDICAKAGIEAIADQLK